MIKKLILRIKHSLIGYKTRCFIFGKTKTNSKNMKQIEELRSEIEKIFTEQIALSLDKSNVEKQIKFKENKKRLSELQKAIETISKNCNKYLITINQESNISEIIYLNFIDLNIDSWNNILPNCEEYERFKVEVAEFLVRKYCDFDSIEIKRIK